MTLNEILTKAGKTPDQIVKIYHGKDRWCRCGCGGNYFYDEKQLDMRGFKRSLNVLNNEEKFNFSARVDEIEYGKTYINIPFGEYEANKCYCIYFKFD